MRKRKRQSYTAAGLAQVWDRWGRGESSKTIARLMSEGRRCTRCSCGTAASTRESADAPQALTLAEREEISRGLACGESLRQVARRLARAVWTVSREIRRDGGSARYRASGGRVASVAAKATPEAVSAGTLSPATPNGRTVGAGGPVSATDRRLAEARLSGQRVTLRVARNDLPKSFSSRPAGDMQKELTPYLRSKRTFRRRPIRPSAPNATSTSKQASESPTDERLSTGHTRLRDDRHRFVTR